MDGCKHKYRTNLDGLQGLNGSRAVDTLYSKGTISPYVTIIFCENCGHVSYDANWSMAQRKEHATLQAQTGDSDG